MQITFIIPTYNRKELLLRAIKSIAISNIPKEEYEIIVVDDGSICNNKEVIDKFKDIDITYFRYDENTGNESLMRNTGINLAKGKYIRFIDDDDYFDCISLYREYLYIINNLINDDILFVNRMLVNNKYNDYNIRISGLFNGIANFYIKRAYIYSEDIVFSDNKFKSNSEDLYFFILMYINTDNISVINDNYVISYITNWNDTRTYHTNTKFSNFNLNQTVIKIYEHFKDAIKELPKDKLDNLIGAIKFRTQKLDNNKFRE